MSSKEQRGILGSLFVPVESAWPVPHTWPVPHSLFRLIAYWVHRAMFRRRHGPAATHCRPAGSADRGQLPQAKILYYPCSFS